MTFDSKAIASIWVEEMKGMSMDVLKLHGVAHSFSAGYILQQIDYPGSTKEPEKKSIDYRQKPRATPAEA